MVRWFASSSLPSKGHRSVSAQKYLSKFFLKEVKYASG
jgi:hypothetical protein